MSLIKHRFLPRSKFNTNDWFSQDDFSSGVEPSLVDLFDPYDALDMLMSNGIVWLNEPKNLVPIVPQVPEKYRFTLDCYGYDPKSIKTEVSKDKTKLIVSGTEGEKKNEDEDYSIKHFRKTFHVPKNGDFDKMASFMTSDGQLVVEVPFKTEPPATKKSTRGKHVKHTEEATGVPKLIEENGAQRVEVNINLPESIDPSKIKVTCKDHDLIVHCEHETKSKDSSSKFYYYRRCTLPKNTDFDSLKCIYEHNSLSITAPVKEDARNGKRAIPIEMKGHKKLKHDE